MILITANIGRAPHARAAHRNIDLVRKSSRENGVIGFQEIDEGDKGNEHAIIRELFPRGLWEHVGMDTMVPILVPHPFRVLDHEVIKGIPGIAKVTPARVFNRVLLEHTERDLDPFWITNCHYPRRKHHAGAKAWEQMHLRHREIAAGDARSGQTGVWMGDVNKKNMPKVHPQEKRLVTRGIDSISVVERSVKVTLIRSWMGNLSIDGHNTQCCSLALSR